jgi:hypothetical protein
MGGIDFNAIGDSLNQDGRQWMLLQLNDLLSPFAFVLGSWVNAIGCFFFVLTFIGWVCGEA